MKSHLSLRVILLLSIFYGFCMPIYLDGYQPDVSVLVDIVTARAEKIIEKKYKLKACGAGIGMPGGIVEHLGLAFNTNKPLTKDQLRILLIEFAQILLHEVTSNKEIQPFLIQTPFTLNNIQIIFYNNNIDGREVFDPGISTAQILSGVLDYRTIDPDTFRYKKIVEEPYEEALKILQSSGLSQK